MKIFNYQEEDFAGLMKKLSGEYLTLRVSADLALFLAAQLMAAKRHPTNGKEQNNLLDLLLDPILQSLNILDENLNTWLEKLPTAFGGVGSFSGLSFEHQIFILNLMCSCKLLELELSEKTGETHDAIHWRITKEANQQEYQLKDIHSRISMIDKAVGGTIVPLSQDSRRDKTHSFAVGYWIRLGDGLFFVTHDTHHRREVAQTQLSVLRNVHRKLDWSCLSIL